jgi:hypothetical protein
MTDEDLAKYLCIYDDARWPRVIAKLDAKTRACYERMAEVEVELNLWTAGLGPKPKDVIILKDRRARGKQGTSQS